MLTLPKTKRAQDALKCDQGRDEYRSSDFQALYLYIGPKSKTWYLKCSHKKKRPQIKISPYALMNYQQALECARQLYHSIVMGTYDPKKSVTQQTFSEFFEQQFLPKAKQSKSSWASDLSKYNTYLKDKFGTLVVDTITKEQIQAYLSALPLSAATINKHLSLLSSVFKLAVEQELIGISPVKGIKKLKENNERVAFFTNKQSADFDRIAAQDMNEDASNLLLCLKKTGARLSELQNLTFDGISFEQKIINIAVSKSGYSRQIYLSDEVIGILRTLEQKYSGIGYVFRQKDGVSAIGHPRTTLKRILKAIGMESSDFRVHDLRHDFCTRVLKEGKGKITLYHVSKLAGHRSITSTSRYAHIADDELHAMANLA